MGSAGLRLRGNPQGLIAGAQAPAQIRAKWEHGGGAVDMGGTLLKGPTRWSLGPWSSVLVSCAAPSLCPKAHITDTFSGHQASPQIAGFLLWGWGGEVPKPRGWVRGSYPHPRAGVLPASPRASSSLTVAGGRGLHL